MSKGFGHFKSVFLEWYEKEYGEKIEPCVVVEGAVLAEEPFFIDELGVADVEAALVAAGWKKQEDGEGPLKTLGDLFVAYGGVRDQVEHQEEKRRFVWRFDDGSEGEVTYYEEEGNVVVFDHTFVPEQHRGKGAQDPIIKAAYDWARANGKRIKNQCWYLKDICEKMPKWKEPYGDLFVAHDEAFCKVK